MPMPPLAELKRLFRAAPFIAELGLELESIAPGECVTSLALEPRHLQQYGAVHAGVLATVADHTAGGAAYSLVADGCRTVTVEFKLSLLRTAASGRLECRARVLKPGRQFSFVESEVFCTDAGKTQLVAKASATIAVLPPAAGEPQGA
jgi:uncharacterized protein (TIGR00369 family)